MRLCTVRPPSRRFWIANAALALAWPLAAAQQEQSVGKLRVDVNLVLLDATLKDRSGKVMNELRKEDFVLDEDGAAQTIAHFSRDEMPLAVALVVQSNSWVGQFLQPLRYATQSMLKALKPEDQVALFTFDETVARRVDLTAEKQRVAEAMNLPGRGMDTNINTAVYEAARYLRDQAPAARRVILLVSDNRPAACLPGVEHGKVLNTALEADTPVYSLKLPYKGSFLSLSGMAEHWLINVNKLTRETGGEVVEVEKEGGIYLAFQTIFNRLKTRYTLGFYPAGAPDGKFHRLNLSLQPSFGKRGKEYTVLNKTGYYAQPPRAASR